MKSREEIESLVQEYLVELKSEEVDPSRFGFEVSTYLKSLASMDRNPIASDLANDADAIANLINASERNDDARLDAAFDRIEKKYGIQRKSRNP